MHARSVLYGECEHDEERHDHHGHDDPMIFTQRGTSAVARAVGFADSPADTAGVSEVDGQQTVVITARSGSCSPENVQVRSGVPTTLFVKSENAQGCVRSFVIRDEQKILPVRGETRIDLGVLQPGRLDYACGMGMYTGVITIV